VTNKTKLAPKVFFLAIVKKGGVTILRFYKGN